MSKIDVIYRCCNSEVDTPHHDAKMGRYRPPWYDKIKCLKSFINAAIYAEDVIGKLIFIHDGKKGRLYENIPTHYDILEINHNDNNSSLIETFKIADTLTNDVYFVEDDYLHCKTSIMDIKYGVEQLGLVTGYDHLDRYKNNDDITNGKDYIKFIDSTNKHWRTCESTCCTWATTRELWNGTVGEYAKHYKLYDRDLFRALYTTKDIRLWSPIPGVTTQVDANLSPAVDWENLI